MYNTRKIYDDIHWIGVSDRTISRFENMFPLSDGVCYNSYFIDDEKTAVLDTVDSSVGRVFMENIEYLLNGRDLDYLVINHMEPDHCANITSVVLKYPNVKLVGNAKTFKFLEQFYDGIPSENYLTVKDGEVLELGKHSLMFIMAPLVHWPEVMMTYEKSKKILFSADAFGSFGSLNGNIFSDEFDFEVKLLPEIRRYYTNIVGKFGQNVQMVFKKLANLEIDMLASLHGPIYRNKDDISFMLGKYNKWSTYTPERKGVVIAYSSMYGNTQEVVSRLAVHLAQEGVKNIEMFDVSHTHASHIIGKVFEYSNLVVTAVNYNTTLYYPMEAFLKELCGVNIQNRNISYLSNTTWGGTALKVAKEILEGNKNMNVVGEVFEITSSMKKEQDESLLNLAKEIKKSLD